MDFEPCFQDDIIVNTELWIQRKKSFEKRVPLSLCPELINDVLFFFFIVFNLGVEFQIIFLLFLEKRPFMILL